MKFTAEWCQPCQKIDPFFGNLATTFNGVFVKIDVDELDDVAAECDVAMMPTFVVFREGVLVERLAGAYEEKLKDLVEKYVPVRQARVVRV